MIKAPKEPSMEERREWTKQCVAREIVENLEAEAEAIGKYLPLLNQLKEGGYKKAEALVREIISDEKNHLLILQGMLQEFDGDIPVAEDNVQGALQRIKKSIEKDPED